MKNDAASIVARYVTVSPMMARAIVDGMSDDARREIEAGAAAARVAELVNEHLASEQKAAVDADENGGER